MFNLTIFKRGFEKKYIPFADMPTKPFIKLTKENNHVFYKLTEREPKNPDISVVIDGIKHYIKSPLNLFDFEQCASFLKIVDKIDTSVSQTVFGEVLAGSQNWAYPTLSKNGKIYSPPYYEGSILEIDPETDSTINFGSASGGGSYYNFVLAENGSMYSAGLNGTNILKLDPESKVITTFGNISGGMKVGKGILGSDNKIYFPPEGKQLLVIDPNNDSFVQKGDATSFYSTCSNSIDGNIYLIPRNPNTGWKIKKYSIESDTIISLTDGLGDYVTSQLGINGAVYAFPVSSYRVLKIENDNVSFFGNMTQQYKFYTSKLAPNGKIYAFGSSSPGILELDTENDTLVFYGSSINLVHGSALSKNGRIYSPPNGAYKCSKITTTAINEENEVVLSPYFNTI